MAEEAPPKKRSRLEDLMGGEPLSMERVDVMRADGNGTTSDLPPWHARANDVVRFHFLDDLMELERPREDMSFFPSYTHQIFREDETIRGYEGLRVDVWLHAGTLHALVEVHYDRKLSTIGASRDRPDDVIALLKDKWPCGFTQDREEFKSMCAESQGSASRDLGSVVARAGESAVVLHSNFEEKSVRELHARAEPLILFLIDGSSFIDPEDKRWEVLFLIEKSEQGERIAGYATLYKFYAHPDSTRIRLSQLVVFPCFQGRGYGSALIEATYAIAGSSNALDVTVEDPTVDLQRLRDVHDLKRMISVPFYKDAVAAAIQTATERGEDPTLLRPPSSLLRKAQMDYKMCAPQTRRCWDALLLMEARKHPSCLPMVRTFLRDRLQSEYFSSERKKADGKRLMETESGFLMLSGFKEGTIQMEEQDEDSLHAQEDALKHLLEESMMELERLHGSLLRHPPLVQ